MICQLCLWLQIYLIQLTRPYYQLFHQEQPGVFHQMCQMRLISFIIQLCSNFSRALILANNCTWWQVYSALVFMVVYQIPKVCLALMYMKHTQIVYGKLHILPFIFLGQNENYNTYSTPLRHEVWNVDHKMIILGIDFCYNTFSHLWVKHHHYLEHDTVCLSIFFPCTFFIFLDKWHHLCGAFFSDALGIP